MRNRWTRPLFVSALGLLCLASLACSSSSDAVDAGPPADVSGTWDYVITNADLATLTNCTGILLQQEGTTVADLLAAALVCTTTEDFVVTQLGTRFTAEGQTFTCPDGSTYTLSGSGSVNGTNLTGSLLLELPNGTEGTELFNGVVDAQGVITLQVYRLTLSTGLLSGSCDIEPDLEQVATLIPDPVQPLDPAAARARPARPVAALGLPSS